MSDCYKLWSKHRAKTKTKHECPGSQQRSQCSHIIQQNWGSRQPHFANRLCTALETPFCRVHCAAPCPADMRRSFRHLGTCDSDRPLCRVPRTPFIRTWGCPAVRRFLSPPSVTCEHNPFVWKTGQGNCGSFWNIKIIFIENRIQRRMCWSPEDMQTGCVYHCCKLILNTVFHLDKTYYFNYFFSWYIFLEHSIIHLENSCHFASVLVLLILGLLFSWWHMFY